ncbi:MAG: hypothetical protein LBL06_02415 [Treponema sp.]|jgi:electron transfer flavoprotein beta subunit|nr:hypothetical protein [Treponema sp.]
MKIVVCFKAVPEFDQVVDEDWNSFHPTADWGYVKRIFGCFDESALETALRLRSAWQEYNEEPECTALTASPLPSPLCKTLFATGFDRVVDLWSGLCGETPTTSLEFQPRQTAALLADYLSSAGYDLILAGRQAGYADTGTVPLLLAEMLGIPVITGIEEIAPCGGGAVEIKRVSDTARERLKVRLPVIVTLGNSPVSALRAVTLSARMSASKRNAETPTVSLPHETTAALPCFSLERVRKTCRFFSVEDGLPMIISTVQEEYSRR